ncbi:conserved Plasmodium protein, unknown function [Plasmodium gaboni]|uniref:Ubiquinol-cytochrome c chaperone domain-containing protein n=1 Tax=Plasmodium gaboni TaxID=647221 RepID=A0ABY1UUP3_9APIC|nr:conserved Plasmodium protein, unknown function [Plasmodium gaboni]
MYKYLRITNYKHRNFKCVKRFKCIIDNTLNDNKLKWKTTKESYCEYILNEEEEKEIRKNHEYIISNKNINIDNTLIYECIKKYNGNNISDYYKILNSNLNNLYCNNSIVAYYYLNFVNKFMKNIKQISIVNYITNIINSKFKINIHIFISPIYERINNQELLSNFHLNKNDVREIMYFICMHVWIYCVKLNMINNNHLKVLLWEKIWDYYRALIIQSKIPEFSFNTYLVNMQEYSLGFCVGLDDCITKELYAGHISNLLFNHVYNENENYKSSKELSNLTIYCIRMYNFICHLPQDNFVQAKFIWPDFKYDLV